jgi:hypothetical protein
MYTKCVFIYIYICIYIYVYIYIYILYAGAGVDRIRWMPGKHYLQLHCTQQDPSSSASLAQDSKINQLVTHDINLALAS